MSQTDSQPLKKHKRRWSRRLLIVLLVLLAIALAAWKVAERYIDVNRYRPRLEAEIKAITGLPASIGNLNLDILPAPCLEATAVSVGKGDFQAYAPRVVARASIRELLHRRLCITSIESPNVAITVPADNEVLLKKIRDLARSVRGSQEPKNTEKGPAPAGKAASRAADRWARTDRKFLSADFRFENLRFEKSRCGAVAEWSGMLSGPWAPVIFTLWISPAEASPSVM